MCTRNMAGSFGGVVPLGMQHIICFDCWTPKMNLLFLLMARARPTGEFSSDRELKMKMCDLFE